MRNLLSKIIFVGLLLFSFCVFSQDTLQTPKNKKQNIHIEFAGTSFLYSVNYERMFWQKNNYNVGASVGLAVFAKPVFSYNSASVPLGVYGLWGRKLSFYHALSYNSLFYDTDKYSFKAGISAGINYTIKNTFFIRAYPSTYYDYDFKGVLIFYGVRAGVWF